MYKMERVSVDNIVVRFFTEKSEAEHVALLMGFQVFKHSVSGRYVIASTLESDYPEIYDAVGLVMSAKNQARNLDSRLWVEEMKRSLSPA
jgi:hypothetical protein